MGTAAPVAPKIAVGPDSAELTPKAVLATPSEGVSSPADTADARHTPAPAAAHNTFLTIAMPLP
ncbi:MAG: hypothetical protein BGO12_17175 [Verrucomicrobia bacterium 61-8]|nr:MAG: hypothetical protein BGO12_17175 [Verrucomicrobia bacterium 61-8]